MVVQVKKEKHNCSELNYVELHVLLVKPQCLMCKTPSLFHGTRTGQFILAPVVILSYFCIGIPSAWLNLLPGGIWHINSRFNRWKLGLNQKKVVQHDTVGISAGKIVGVCGENCDVLHLGCVWTWCIPNIQQEILQENVPRFWTNLFCVKTKLG